MLLLQQELAKTDEEKLGVEEGIALFSIIKTNPSFEEKKAALESKYQNTTDPKDLVAISIFYKEENRDYQALEQINKAVKTHPKYGIAGEMKAYLELQNQQYESAKLSIQKAREYAIDPVYPFLLGIVYQTATENAESANQSLQELIDAQPENKKGLAFRKWLEKE